MLKKHTYNSLNKYARNLNQLAKDGKLDPVIGRDEEIRRILQILSRRTKNNPILVGEPGTGKTAIAEGLAHTLYRPCPGKYSNFCRYPGAGKPRCSAVGRLFVGAGLALLSDGLGYSTFF